jgi:hypothetical protein
MRPIGLGGPVATSGAIGGGAGLGDSPAVP